jgi:hypothetical protein
MKSVINRIVIGLVLVAVTGVVSLAKEKHSITVPTDIKVNGTDVKRGEYDLVFDEQGGELLIMKGKKVIAKTTARVEKRSSKARTTEFNTRGEGASAELIGITLSGKDEAFVVTGGSTASGNN